MKAYYTDTQGRKAGKIRTLGGVNWLLRKAGKVKTITIRGNGWRVEFEADLDDGTRFVTYYGHVGAAMRLAQRKTFKNAVVYVAASK